MADKKEIALILLGLVAVLAIIGLVLLFTRTTPTGSVAIPARPSSIIIVPPEYPCDAAPLCPNGRPPVDLNLNLYDIETRTFSRACWCELPPQTPKAITEMPLHR